MNMKYKIRRPYTLIELLLVIGIAAILIGAGVPAFTRLAKGKGTVVSCRNISGMIKASRAFAISKRQKIAILFPTATVPEDYRYDHTRVCQVWWDKSSSEWVFKQWLKGEKWEDLPAGVSVVATTADGDDFITNVKVHDVNCEDIETGLTDVDNVRALVFLPSGRLAGADGAPASADATLRIAEKTYSGGALVSTGSDNNIDITINPFTGRVSYLVE